MRTSSVRRSLAWLALVARCGAGCCAGIGSASAGELAPFDVRRLEQGIEGAPRHAAPRKSAVHADLLRSGTAFFINRAGDMLTSAHVVRGCQRIDIWPGEMAGIQATLVAIDNTLDVALLSTGQTVGMAAAPLDQPVAAGASVYTIGFGLTASSPRVPVVTHGTVNGTVDDRGRRLLVLRAALHEGNSGGPVVDAKGMLRGMIIGRYTNRPELSVAVGAQDLARFVGPDRVDSTAVPLYAPAAVKATVRLKQIAALVQCEK